MGHSWVEVEISDLENKRSSKVNALVDTGATLTVLPKRFADKLGIKPVFEEKIATAAGEIKVLRGESRVKIKNRETVTPVWISDIVDKVLIGVVTLESLGLEVDPVSETLKERPLLLY
jgi:clan AA aspartic protease